MMTLICSVKFVCLLNLDEAEIESRVFSGIPKSLEHYNRYEIINMHRRKIIRDMHQILALFTLEKPLIAFRFLSQGNSNLLSGG